MESTTKLTTQKIKPNKKSLGIFAGVIAVLGIIFLLVTFAATPGTPAFGLYVSPSASSPKAGQQFTVSVYANLGNTSVQSMAAFMHYDTTQLRLDSANQAGIDPNFTVTSRCTNIDGCKPAGDIVFVAGYSGSGAITPADGVLIGNMTFTALKTGTANLTFDPDTKLSGFTSPTTPQTTLDTRTVLNGVYTVIDGTAPSVPAGLASPSKTMTSVNLTWPASTDEAGGSGMAGYRIYRNGGATAVGTSATNTFNDTGLAPGTTYTYKVAAYDNAGNTSAQSATALSVTTSPDTQAPTVPGKPVGGTVTMNTIDLTWAASTDNVAVAGYKILRNGTQVGTSATTSYKDSGLAPATSYSYTIVAYDNANPANNSAPSTATAVSTGADTQAPSTPGGLSASTPTSNSAALSWTASTDNLAVTGYRILRNGMQIGTTAGNVTTYTDSGLAPGNYSYTVTAVDAAGNVSGPTGAQSIKIYAPVDINKDGVVGIADLTIVLNNYGKSGASISGDTNGDSIVNIQDIGTLLASWGTAG